MTGFTNYVADKTLDFWVGKTSMVSLPTAYAALFTGVGTDVGSGFTEVSGGSYTRVATSASTWNAASGTGPSSNNNALAITFPTSTAPWGTVIAVGLFDDPAAGNLLVWDYLGNFDWLPCTVSSGSPGIITAPAHGISVGNSLVFSTEYGGTAPSFSASNFTGVLLAAHAATDTLDVTNAATQVNTSTTGNGMIRQIVPTIIGSGATPAFASAATTIICT